jgi:UDP-glucuronate 4-epimerase
MKILVTGAAGFIGFHLVQRLLKEGFQVVGLDNVNSYYDVNLKYARLAETGIYAVDETNHTGGKNRQYKEISFGDIIQSVTYSDYRFIRLNLEDKSEINQLFSTEKFDYVVNLAAQAGVRYSIENPDAYIQSNIVGFLNILEACRNYPVKHLVYASSSSVYGTNSKVPFSEDDRVDYPVSIYAATKKANELMAYTYSHLYKFSTTGLRFFTVYGPWGRPDMSPILFADAITHENPVKVFNNGEMKRDFTYIDDIVEGVIRLIDKAPTDGQEHPYYALFNIGNSQPINLMDFIQIVEQLIGKRAKLEMYSMQPGDVEITYADTTRLAQWINYQPSTSLKNGLLSFVAWYNHFYFPNGFTKTQGKI